MSEYGQYWTYRPGSRVRVYQPNLAGVWEEVQPREPAWSWLGATPQGAVMGDPCGPFWTYRPDSPVYVVHPGGSGVWREVQSREPAWSWLGVTPRQEQQRKERARYEL